jgi:hypothetical protein
MPGHWALLKKFHSKKIKETIVLLNDLLTKMKIFGKFFDHCPKVKSDEMA